MDTSEREQVSDESPTTSRRAFIGTAGGAAGALFAGSAGALGALPGAAIAADTRSFTTARELLYLEGLPMGLLSGRDGGLPFVEVKSLRTGIEPVKGVAGTVKYEPLILQFGAGMPNSLFQWIADSMQLQPSVKRSGFIAFVGIDGNEGGRLNFTNALISEVTLPALDGASKEAVAMTITLVPEFTQLFLSPTTAVKHTLTVGPKTKNWLGANYRMAIDKIDLKSLMAVDAQTTTIKIGSSQPGQDRLPISAPTGIENGNLVLTVREVDARQFLDWFNQLWGPNGNPNDPALLRTATLNLMSVDMKAVLGTVIFRDVGVARISPQRLESNADAIRKCKIELYVGSTTIDPKSFV